MGEGGVGTYHDVLMDFEKNSLISTLTIVWECLCWLHRESTSPQKKNVGEVDDQSPLLDHAKMGVLCGGYVCVGYNEEVFMGLNNMEIRLFCMVGISPHA